MNYDKVGVVVVDLLEEFRVLVLIIMPGNRIWRFPVWFWLFCVTMDENWNEWEK